MATLPLLNPIVAGSPSMEPVSSKIENMQQQGTFPQVKAETRIESLKRVHSSSSVTASDDNLLLKTSPHHPQKADSDSTGTGSGGMVKKLDFDDLATQLTKTRRRKERAKVTYKCYTQDDMQTAYKLYIESKRLGNTISIRRLAKVTGIPYATLRDHINGRKNKSSGLVGEMQKVTDSMKAAFPDQRQQFAQQMAALARQESAAAALSQPSVQSLLAALQQGKESSPQSIVCESRVVPSSAVISPTANRINVPTMQIVPEKQHTPTIPTMTTAITTTGASAMVMPPPAAVLSSLLSQHTNTNTNNNTSLAVATPTVTTPTTTLSTVAEVSSQPESHGVQDVLRYMLDKDDLAMYYKAMVDHDVAFLKQLELVKTVNLSINKNTVTAQQLRALMRTGVDYFSPFFSRRCKLNGAARLSAQLSSEVAQSFLQRKLLSQSVEVLQPKSLQWMHGLRFSELALKSVTALHTGGMFRAILSQEMVQMILQLGGVWASLEQNLSATLKKIQEGILVRGAGGVTNLDGVSTTLMKEYLQVLSKADEMRVLIMSQVENILKEDILVLAFRIELFDKYLEASNLGLQDPCSGVLTECKIHLIDILKSVYTLDLSLVPPKF